LLFPLLLLIIFVAWPTQHTLCCSLGPSFEHQNS
jgi:hypothetical protein